jgi:hypothetical protein
MITIGYYYFYVKRKIIPKAFPQCCGSGSGTFLTPGSGIPDPTIISESLKPIFSWVKNLKKMQNVQQL